jgi:sugar lactone lactonase YvrE
LESILKRPRLIHTLVSLSLALPILAGTAVRLVPQLAPAGARFVIAGSGLDRDDVSIGFASSGGSVPASVVGGTATIVEGVVPLTATSGSVRVTQGGALLGTFPFTLASSVPLVRVSTLPVSNGTQALLKAPSSVAVVLSTGEVLIADTAHHRIVAVTTAGALRVLAGSGSPGSGDGSGTAAQFKSPSGLAIDQAGGVVYVADTGNHLIRRVTLDGNVTTLAGSGRPDDADGSSTQAGFKQPMGIAVDRAGNIYVADTGSNRIRAITPAGVVRTLAGATHEGSGDGPALQALFKQPQGIAVGPSGAVWIADTKNNVIRKLENGAVSTIGTGHGGFVDGNGSVAEFKEPSGVSVGESGEVYVADTKNNALRRIVESQRAFVVSTIAGASKAGLVDGDLSVARFDTPIGVLFAGALYVADSGNDAVRLLLPSVQLSAIEPDSGPPAGGNDVRVFGTGFVPGGTSVLFGTAAATRVTFISSTELLVTAPPGVGNVDVTVTTAAGSDRGSGAYTYLTPPTIASVSPAKGPVSGGTPVTILGSGFVDEGRTRVFFGSAEGTSVRVLSPSKLTVVAPASFAGPADVIVTTQGGTAKATGAFNYLAPPAIVAFAPSGGRPGTVVTVSGSNFDPLLSANVVRFGSFPAVVVSSTPTLLTVTVPPNAVTAPISVTTDGGSAVSAAVFQIVSYAGLAISPTSPAVDAGGALQLTARGVAADGTTTDVTSQATWSASPQSVATVSTSGLVHGLQSGTASITATLGTLSSTVTLTVQTPEPLPPDPQTVATPLNPHSVTSFADGVKFLFTGPAPIQSGVAAGAFDDRRLAVVRGRVLARDGSALAGVHVRVLGHDEAGHTLSRADGVFDLAVNGGGNVTVVYEKSGYLPSQRTVDVAWQDFTWSPDVVLIPLDANVTAVDLSSPRLQLARGGIASDRDGTRQTVLLFPSGTTASLTMPDGTSRPLAVEFQDVVPSETTQGRIVSKCGMCSVNVVEVQVGRE